MSPLFFQPPLTLLILNIANINFQVIWSDRYVVEYTTFLNQGQNALMGPPMYSINFNDISTIRYMMAGGSLSV